MSIIKMYSKYMDAKNRMFIVIERYGKYDFENGIIEPSTLKLLNVADERTDMVTNEDFNTYIAQGKLKQV